MKILDKNKFRREAFTLVEVCVALFICVLFGAAAFATNSRLLLSLKNQKESTAATTALQWRMEKFRATAFSSIATAGTSSDYVNSNILMARTATFTDTNGNTITVDPFAPLGSITEQFTIGVYPSDGSTPTVMSWDANHPNGQYISQNTNLGSANLLKIDVLETWISANGRTRTRQLSEIFGHGSLGQ